VPKRESAHGRFAYDGLERLIHEKARLGILTCLATHSEGMVFNDLKSQCALTDGNLNRHIAVLADESLVEVWKGGGGSRRAQTLYRLTNSGRERFLAYLAELERVVRDAATAAKQTPSLRVKPT